MHGEPHALVEVALLVGELDLADELALGRQLGGHLLLGAPEQERPDAPAEECLAVGIASSRCGF
jgi:hypothetical protein